MSTAAVTQDPTKPIEITLGDGSVVKGANLEEAFKNLQTMKENASSAIRAEKERREQLEGELNEWKQKAVKPEPVRTDGFDKQKYYTLLNDDPIAAQNYIDSARFGVSDPVAAFNGMRTNVDSLQQQSVSAAFISLHAEDFPATPENAKLLTAKTAELLNSGIPYNIETVNYAYSQLVQEGKIKPLEKTKEEDETPPPSLRGSGGNISDTELQRAEQMSDKDLESLLRSKGVLR